VARLCEAKLFHHPAHGLSCWCFHSRLFIKPPHWHVDLQPVLLHPSKQWHLVAHGWVVWVGDVVLQQPGPEQANQPKVKYSPVRRKTKETKAMYTPVKGQVQPVRWDPDHKFLHLKNGEPIVPFKELLKNKTGQQCQQPLHTGWQLQKQCMCCALLHVFAALRMCVHWWLLLLCHYHHV